MHIYLAKSSRFESTDFASAMIDDVISVPSVLYPARWSGTGVFIVSRYMARSSSCAWSNRMKKVSESGERTTDYLKFIFLAWIRSDFKSQFHSIYTSQLEKIFLQEGNVNMIFILVMTWEWKEQP